MAPHARRTNSLTRRSSAGKTIPAFFLYGEPLQPLDERLVHIETIAARSRLHNWTIRPHRHRDLHQVLLLLDGRVSVRLDACFVELGAPALIVVPPGTVHSFSFQPATDGMVMSFAPGLVREVAGLGSDLTDLMDVPRAYSLQRSQLNATDLRELSLMLLREFTRSAPARVTALRGLLSAILANVARLAHQAARSSHAAGSAERELVARFRKLIETQYTKHQPISSYLTELGVSLSKLRRACLDTTGQSPMDLVHLRLLVEAERQLRYTTMSISQIAYHLGFEDPAYFSRFFSRLTKESPRAFRARDKPGSAAGSQEAKSSPT
jgi:AraC family transcriptional regulator, transcriptional activator of pobA